MTDVTGLWSKNGSNIYYSSGNVGIGKSIPDRSLHVRNAGGIAEIVIQGKQSSSVGNAAKIILSTAYDSIDASNQEGRRAEVAAIADGDWGQNVRLGLFTSQAANISPTERLTVLGNGKVGIGTTSPAATKDVSGTIKASGTVQTGQSTASTDCDADDDIGKIRLNSTTGRLQICRASGS